MSNERAGADMVKPSIAQQATKEVGHHRRVNRGAGPGHDRYCIVPAQNR
jgi:hypothetical protein